MTGQPMEERMDELERRVRELVMLLRVVVIVACGNFAGHVLETLHGVASSAAVVVPQLLR